MILNSSTGGLSQRYLDVPALKVIIKTEIMSQIRRGRGGGDSHIKATGVVVVPFSKITARLIGQLK